MMTAFILGLAGSLHCAGMCGPLVLMTPVVGKTRASFIASRLLYHLGRIATYSFIGLLFGLVGESMMFAGFQRWLSIIPGILLLLAIFYTTALERRLARLPLFIKNLFGRFLHQRTFASVAALGAVNGLLPCGLVYIAATASIAFGSAAASVLYMLFFGLGTVPMLLSISILGRRFKFSQKPFLSKLAPIAAAVVAILLIVRAQPLTLLSSSKPFRCSACQP